MSDAAAMKISCNLCPRKCGLSDGQTGFCGARRNEGGEIKPIYYGIISSLALDPIEKKPLYHFRPGKMILSCGSFGCNMSCYFCQNHSISQPSAVPRTPVHAGPEKLTETALSCRDEDNVGLAFTYNEPLVNYEFVLDTAKLIRENGLDFILVTNAQIEPSYFTKLLPYVSALNIDLKCFSAEGYRRLGGDFETVLENIRLAALASHLEITTLVVPGLSDSLQEMEAEARFIADLNPEIPLHLSRYFPAYRSSEPATNIEILERLRSVAENHLGYVYLGNVYQTH